MNIRERRFNHIVNQILREELQKGNLPSSKEFIWKVNEYLLHNDISKPSFAFNPVRKGTLARAKDYNDNMHTAHDDLEMLYVSVISQHNLAMKNFNKFDVEKAKLDYELSVLENELKELILLYGGEAYLSSVYDMLTDFNFIDVGQTTAHVNIQSHEIMIPDLKNMSKKILPKGTASFDPLPDIAQSVERKVVSGTPKDALSDSVNQNWKEMLLADSKMNVGGYYTVVFDQVQSLNRIAISLQSTKPTFIRIEVTSDNINWIPLPYYEEGVRIQDKYTFDFPTLDASKLRVLMAKTEPDGETLVQSVQSSTAPSTLTDWGQIANSTSDLDPVSRRYNAQSQQAAQQTQTNLSSDKMKYQYIFGIKNLSFFTNTYSNAAEAYSTKLVVDSASNFTIDKVSLLVNEELPNGTEIQYYVAIPPEGTNPIDWKPLSPVNREQPKYDQLVDFKNVAASSPNLFSIDPSISMGEYELESLATNGISFYKIGEITGRQIIDGTEKLFVGKNTWGVQSYAFQHADHATHLPSVEDWRTPQGTVTTKYTKIQDGKPGILLNQETASAATNYMFTLGVFSKANQQMTSSLPVSTDPIAIYMNGALIYQGTMDTATSVNYLFKPGWNEIVAFLYSRNSMGTVNGATLDLSFDPRKFGSSVYAKAQPLSKVALFDLRHNVLNTDHMKYALNVVNNKTQVILNNAVPGLDYEFYYNYIDGTAKNNILFKAVLSRDDSITQTSPKLKSYRLRFS